MTPKENKAKRKVLVIDDDSIIRSAIATVLGRNEFIVAGAKNGEEARSLMFESRANIFPYDLILLDIGLGRTNGLDFLEEIRDKGVKVPILMISGSADQEDVGTASKFQVKGYLVKPFDNETLIKKVRGCFHWDDPES